jgi:diguanylate cyclase (GGDEF)-like protein
MVSERFRPRLYESLNMLIPAALYAGLLGGMPYRWPAWWFGLAGAATVFYTALAVKRKRSHYHRFALFMAGMLIAGVTAYTGQRWLHMAYIPYALAVSLFFSMNTTLIMLIAVPLFEVLNLASGIGLYEELSLLLFTALAALMGMVSRRLMDRENAAAKAGRYAYDETDRSSFRGLEREKDPEIRDTLRTVMFTVMPDSASLFLLQKGELALRCSTAEETETLHAGLIHDALGEGRTMVARSTKKKRPEAGYRRRGRVSSVTAVPVKDGRLTLGVLAADSKHQAAFTERDLRALELFASRIAGVLGRQRVQAEIERTNLGLKALQQESAKLVTTLDMETVLDMAMEGMRNIAPLNMALFLKENKSYRLVRTEGLEPPERKRYSMKGTLAETAVQGRQRIYISNMVGHSPPALPFENAGTASALMLPLLYQEETLGVMVFISPETDSMSPHQLDLLGILGNQAAVSLKNAMLHEAFRQEAITDGLTGLYNHRHFQEIFDGELRRLKRSPGPLSLILVDIDFFKKINDTYGHPAGDAVLRKTAAIMKKTLRGIDIPARYGGEEFAALLIESDTRGAMQTAERLRKKILETPFRVDGHTVNITVSAGIASCPGDARAKADIIDRADRALYHAKRTGRNRVIPWASLSPR